MRRNHENTNEIVKYNHADLQIVKSDVKAIIAKLEDISYQVSKATFQSVMNEVDLSEFFPVHREEQLEDFMDRSHSDWPARKREFFNYLFNCVTDTSKEFSKGLLKALFARDFMMTAKWPSFG